MTKIENLRTNRRMKRILLFTIVSTIIVSTVMLVGCGAKPEEKQENKPLKLYFVNEKFVETGDESKGTLVEYNGASINVPADLPDGTTKEEQASYVYTTAISKLWTIPEDLKGAVTVVTDEFGLHGVQCKEGIAYVDLVGSELEGKGGSFEETVFISQIVETLIQSFDEIEQVQFLVDGQNAETLMGHCDTSVPFTGSLFQ